MDEQFSEQHAPSNPFPIPDLGRLVRPLVVPPGKTISLASDFDPGYKAHYLEKDDADRDLQEAIRALAIYQGMLYAQDTHALLIILQAMDAAGKDSTIRHVLSGINPQGCRVYSFKAPSIEELDHGFLWRCSNVLPRRGNICVFNRSYYEDVLITRVHPELMGSRQLPKALIDEEIWYRRFREINAFEDYLVNNGTVVLKFFLNVSKSEQKDRLLERVGRPEKNWKYSVKDVIERSYWNDYMAAYEAMFNHTSTAIAPWYIIPADHKWFTRLAVAAVIYTKLKEMNLSYPSLSAQQEAELLNARSMLEQQD
ncbi:polyphosphate kinase 2 family protein [Cyanobium sp. PCC 7001]|uniref:polyphosphate kinase 2 family protein n=1 Tax=Cyanobium sp. PCC 7001 TaxID=180281 RepID=UPI0009FCA914|nr:polyphosphate kinase 2 family protein [Cyanobium sp. PCC 7001]